MQKADRQKKDDQRDKERHRKKEGFQGQKAVVIPRKILANRCAKDPILACLHLTDIGYYPKAKYHYRERPHGAEQHILIYCHEGAGSVRIKKTNYTIEPGDFFVVPIKVAHTYAADENNPWTIYWVHFKGTASDAVVSQIERQANGNKGFIQHNESTIGLFNEIYSEMERGYGSNHLLYANLRLWNFLTTFIYNGKFNPSGNMPYKDTTDMAIDFLSTRIDQVLSLEEIAESVNRSPSHFSFLFKRKTGFSPIEYFNHLKVQKACQYLLFTTLRIKEIALELGFDDPYYFSRLFTKIMGSSPNVYREKRIH